MQPHQHTRGRALRIGATGARRTVGFAGAGLAMSASLVGATVLIALVSGSGSAGAAPTPSAAAATSPASPPPAVSAKLTLNGLQTAAAPNGTTVLTVSVGQSIVFGAGAAPGRVAAVPGYGLTLDAAGLPGGKAGVRLSGTKTYAITINTAGAYGINWTASNLFGSVKLRPGETTQAVISVLPPATAPPGPAGGSSSLATSLPTLPSYTAASRVVVHNTGFAGASPDHGISATATSASASTAAVPSAATSSPSTEVITTSLPSSPALADVADHSPRRPTGLAVLSILALALVAGLYAYRWFTGPTGPAGPQSRHRA